jgi:hypothetical protein
MGSKGKTVRHAIRLAAVIAGIAIGSGAALLQVKANPLPTEPLAAARVMHAGYLAPTPWACPFGSHYTCWRGSYGGRYCGCWPGGDRPACPAGYYYTCRPDPFGNPSCACY